MRQRAFTSGILLAAVAPAWAQQPAKQHRIAIVTSVIPAYLISETGDEASRLLFAALRRLGYVEGRNLTVERYSAEGHPERLPVLAGQVVARKPDLIVASGGSVARAFTAATGTVPIVAVFSDPVRNGLVASLARPGSNVTGVSVDAGVEIIGKRLQMLKEAVPAATRVAYLEVIGSPDTAAGPLLTDAGRRLGLSVIVMPLREETRPEYERVFAEMAQQRVDALLISDQGEALAYRQLIVELAAKNRLPTMCASLDFVEVGGLMAYAADRAAIFHRIADNVHQILNGTNPGTIPVIQPTRFDLMINLNTARALALVIPPTLLAGADQVLEE